MNSKIFTNYSVETINTLLTNTNDDQYASLLEKNRHAMMIANQARGLDEYGNQLGASYKNMQDSAKEKIMLGEIKVLSTEDMVYERLNTYMSVYTPAEKYDKTFDSPFGSKPALVLILLKWIGKLQTVIKQPVTISDGRLASLGLSTLKANQLHDLFSDYFKKYDKMGKTFFNTEFVKIKMEDNKLVAQVGGRAMKTDNGPGTINIGFDGKLVEIIQKLEEDIKQEHVKQKIKQEETQKINQENEQH